MSFCDKENKVAKIPVSKFINSVCCSPRYGTASMIRFTQFHRYGIHIPKYLANCLVFEIDVQHRCCSLISIVGLKVDSRENAHV